MWSYKQLVRDHGEDRALELLQYQIGYGEFDAKTSHWEDNRDTPCNEIHDELPIIFPMTALWEIDIEVGVWLNLWRRLKRNDPINLLLSKDESILSILRQM